MPASGAVRRQSSREQTANPERIVASLEAVLRSFETPDERAGDLLTHVTYSAWDCLRKHIAMGYLCDPDCVQLNICGRAEPAGDSSQGGVRNARGSSALEGFHTYQKGWLGPLSKHSADAGAALLRDGAQRWNRRVRSRKSPAENISSIYAPGLLKDVEAARNHSPDAA